MPIVFVTLKSQDSISLRRFNGNMVNLTKQKQQMHDDELQLLKFSLNSQMDDNRMFLGIALSVDLI